MVRIGKIVATHGLEGSMTLLHITGTKNWLKKEDVLFLELNKESYIPFFVSNIKSSSEDQIILNFEDVTNVEAAKKLVSKAVYADASLLSQHNIDTPLLWIGFNVVDKQKGGLGKIEDVYQTGKQWLGKLTINNKEVLIPLVDQTIIEANIRNKFLRVDLPEGLLDVYLD